MAYYGQRLQPRLKNGVDFQLQNAFHAQNWTMAVRLADKQARATKDPYYGVVKACAETRMDSVADMAAAAVTVDAWVRDGTVPRDLESVELLEWACDEAQTRLDYAQTFGVLRVRWAKANVRNVAGATACLRECLVRWDLVNAQQIATVLDKSSNAGDRRFMFWNILLTHLLSESPQCAEAKRAIYGMLAQKQLEKAAEPAEAAGLRLGADVVAPSADRSLREEEEFLLYFRVLAAHGTLDNYVRRALHPRAGAGAQFAAGARKQLLREVLVRLEAAGRWDIVFDLCQQALAATDDSGRPLTLACDLRTWHSLIAAAQQHPDVERAFDEVQQLLAKFITADPKLPLMHVKNASLALLQTTFGLPASLVPETAAGGSSLRVEQLLVFVEANLEKASVFGDIKPFVERLSFAEAKDVLDRIAAAPSTPSPSSSGRDVMRTVLLLKLRYLLATCPETRCARILLGRADDGDTDSHRNPAAPSSDDNALVELACKVCGRTAPAPDGCTHCLQAIATSSLRTAHDAVTADAAFVQSVLPRLDKDPRVDLALVATSCLLRLAGMHRGHGGRPGRPWLHGRSATRLLQAALVLDAQQRRTPDDIPVRLLLVRVLLVLGSASHALQLWTPLGVKRTILDALGPLMYDRLSTVAPGLFAGAQPPLEPLRRYFATVLQHPSPVKVWDAFAAGSYSSILDMAVFHERLQHSCTRVMTVVEERRAARTAGARTEDVEEVAVFADITNDAALVDVTDYGSLPNLESSHGACLGEAVSLGPGLSDIRMHLGLLAERYLDLINFKPAKEYKPARSADAAARDRAYLLESATLLQVALDDYLHQPDARVCLTPGEWTYYTVVSLLASFLTTCLENSGGSGGSGGNSKAAAGPAPYALLTRSLAAVVAVLRGAVLRPLPSVQSTRSATGLLGALTDLHGLAMLRETAMALKQTAACLTALQDKELARDRTGRSGLAKEALVEARAHRTLATQLLADIKAHIKAIKDALGTPGWFDRVVSTAMAAGDDSNGGDDKALSQALLNTVGGPVDVEEWAGHLLDGWRDTIRGWGQVQLE